MYITPPQPPSVLIKAKAAYTLWFMVLEDFPRVHRYTIGEKIENYFLELLESIFVSIYLAPTQKLVQLGIAITKLDALKFFLQLAWENKCIATNKYSSLSEQLYEIGRMLGGWKRGLEKKTPA